MNVNATTSSKNAATGSVIVPQKTSFPRGDLLHMLSTKQNKIAIRIMNHLLQNALDRGGYKSCFGHGNKIKFLEEFIQHFFCQQDSPFYEIESPNFQVFQGKIKKALDLLEKFYYNMAHSDGKVCDGEEYPAHLKSTVELYVALKEGDKNADRDDSASSKKYIGQNNVIGKNPAPMDKDSNATTPRRDSTCATYESILDEANLAKRGHYHGAGGADIILDMSSDSSDDEGVKTKKRRNNNYDNENKCEKEKCVNIHESLLEECRKELGDLTNTLINVLSRRVQYSEDKLKLKKEMIDRKEDREEKKMVMEYKMILLSQLRHDIDNLRAKRDNALTEVKAASMENGILQQQEDTTIDVLNQSFVALNKSLNEKQKLYDTLQNKMNEDLFFS